MSEPGSAARALLLYAGLAVGLGMVYVLIAALGAGWTGGSWANHAALAGAIGVAAAYRPLHATLDAALARAPGGDRREAHAALEAFIKRPGPDLAAMAQTLAELAARLARAGWAGVWVAGERLGAAGGPPEEPHVGAVSRFPFALPDGAAGELVLGPRADGRPLPASDHTALGALAAHAAAALGAARLLESRLALQVEAEVARALAAERSQLAGQIVRELRANVLDIALAADLGRQGGDAEAAFARIEACARRMDALMADEARRAVSLEAASGA